MQKLLPVIFIFMIVNAKDPSASLKQSS